MNRAEPDEYPRTIRAENPPPSQPEVWLRGPVPDIPAVLQPVAHAFLQSLEDAERLTERQRAVLAAEEEVTPDVPADELLRTLRTTIEAALAQLRGTATYMLDERRPVGSAGLPSTGAGAAVSPGEHTARHAGQISTTVRILQGLAADRAV